MRGRGAGGRRPALRPEPQIPAATRSAASSRLGKGEGGRTLPRSGRGRQAALARASRRAGTSRRARPRAARPRSDEYVAAPHVRQLVREHALGAQPGLIAPEQSGGDRERRALRPSSGRERAREAVLDQVELRRPDSQLSRERVHGRAQDRILGERILTRSEHSEERTVRVRVDGETREERAEDEHRGRSIAAQHPAGAPERGRDDQRQQPHLREVAGGG